MKIDLTSIQGPSSTPAGTALTGAARPDAAHQTASSAIEAVEGKSQDQVQISNLLESLRRAGCETGMAIGRVRVNRKSVGPELRHI